jgi:hypothetical protein
MHIDINLTNIIEWIIAISLGIGGWYVAIRSTLSQQRKERYNDLVQDFHSFIYNFRFQFLPDLISQDEKKYIIQNINRQIKYIYFKAADVDSLTQNTKNKIYQKIKDTGEIFTDSVLLDSDIENALISSDTNEQIEMQRKNFFQFVDKFIEDCYSITRFNIK